MTLCLNSRDEPSPPMVSLSTDTALFLIDFVIIIITVSALLTGYALDPSVDTSQVSSTAYIGAVDEAEKNKGSHFSYMFV